ncbi:DNA cytosine methyltransferase [Pontiella sp.]|uniref:DNA cytosine methyltransferase n=1 Tax=Pontiella sp. TaxID=2837462 RepID=UPI003567096E
MISVNSYFSGAGLLDIGLKAAGLDVAASYELDADAVRVQEGNLGGHVVQCDIANKRVTWPAAIRARMSGKYRDLPIVSDPERGDIAPTCVAHYSKDKSTRLVMDRRFPLGVRPYSVREYARLQGVPDWFTFNCSDTAAYRMIGNGVSVPVGEWIGRELKRYFEA